MSGLSSATVQRLEQLEAQPELQSVDRGELRAMTHSRPTPDERARVDRLLVSGPAAPAPDPTPAPAAPGGAYERGLQRGKSANGRAYSATNER